MKLFRKNVLSERAERAMQKTLANVYAQRRSRFRILACIDETEESFDTVRMAARLAKTNECDIIVLFVRSIDQGLWSGGLQVRVARQNILDAGLELPGINKLKRTLEVLDEEGIPAKDWARNTGHQDAWGDPLGDNKVEFVSEEGRSVVLKLKTAPEPAAGILDQYELGPYNLIIMGEPSRWRGEFRSLFDAGIVQQVAVHAPCSVMVVRQPLDKDGFFICTDGTSRSMQAVRRAAVLAHTAGQPITLFSASAHEAGLATADENVKNARALLKAMGIKVKDIKTAVGPPAKKIVEIGSDYGVIVVTDEGRSRIQRAIKGSTAVEVVRTAKTTVLDVR
jgi:nucleotide-binding universal stress UspA family protein